MIVVISYTNIYVEYIVDYHSFLVQPYKMYIKDSKFVDMRSETNKKRFGNNIADRRNLLVHIKSYMVLYHACSIF